MMISKCILFLTAALLLANCCAVEIGCAPPPGASLAWGGPGAGPADDSEVVEPQLAKRAKRQIASGPLQAAADRPNAKPQPEDGWEKQQAADQTDEARLKGKLTICRACAAGEFGRDEAAGSVTR
jgi:hypothetical protein